MSAVKCPKCSENTDQQAITSEIALGEIWVHQHGACAWFSLSRHPLAETQRWCSLKAAWAATRDSYDDDEWKQGWDAHFKGKERLAARLWKRFEQRQGLQYA